MPAPDFSGATGRSRHSEEDRQEADLRALEDGLVLSAFEDESYLPPLVSTDRSSSSAALPGSPPRVPSGGNRYLDGETIVAAREEITERSDGPLDARTPLPPVPNRASHAAALFRELDVDDSGTLTKEEIADLAAALGHNWRKRQLDAHFRRMLALEEIYKHQVGENTEQKSTEDDEPALEPSIRLAAFLQWWQSYHRGLAHAVMQRCAVIFDELDPYSARTLNEAGAEELRQTLLAENPWINLGDAGEMLRFEHIPKWTSTKLSREQYPGVHNGMLVTREQLLHHYKAQVGADAVELPVFPEHLASKIEEAERYRIKPGDEVVRDGGRPPRRVRSAARLRANSRSTVRDKQRSGRQLWDFLMPRLTVLVKFTKQWGRLHELNPKAEDLLQADQDGAEDPADEEEPQLPRWMFHPDSSLVMNWRRFQVISLIYVLVAAPITVGFQLPLRSPSDAAWWVELLIDIHFLADIPLRFRTVFYDTKTGTPIHDSMAIGQRYLQSWFMIDLLSVLPFSYVALCSGKPSISSALTQCRCIKALRLGQLRALFRPASMSTQKSIRGHWVEMVSTVAAAIAALHIISCGWWLVGTSDTGWRNATATWSSDGADSTALGEQYAQAVYGVIVARGSWAQTTSEFIYCSATEIALIALQVYLTAVAVRMMELSSGTSAAASSGPLSVPTIAEWAHTRGISRSRTAEIEECYRRLYNADKGSMSIEAQVMADLPTPVATQLAEDLYLAYIRKLPFFRGLSRPVLGALCRAIERREVGKDTTVYSEGDSGTELYVILEGEVEVEADGERLGFLGRGGFFGEPAIVEAAANTAAVEAVRTRTIRATMKTQLGIIGRNVAMDVMLQHPELKVRLLSFANLGRAPLHTMSTKRADANRWRHELELRGISNSKSAEMTAQDGGPASIETLRADRLLLRSRIDKMEENQSRQLADTLRIVNKMRSDQLGNKSQIDSMRMDMVAMIAKLDGFVNSYYMKMGRSPKRSS
eukprot:COSAG02_NODE_6038_length_3854_cov_2.278562_1_plen_989_part_00